MARANFIKSARKNIYQKGQVVKYQGQEGSKRQGQTLSKLDRTIPHDKDDPILIHIGESYYWWQFKGSDISYSRKHPKRSQLTHSEFLGWLYDLEDEIGNFQAQVGADYDSPSDLESQRDEWVDSINSQREEIEGRLENMPENLRESSSSGQLLQERIDGLESWASDLENVGIDWDEGELEDQAQEEWDAKKVSDPDVIGSDDDVAKEWVAERLLELKQEKIDEIISELQAQSANL